LASGRACDRDDDLFIGRSTRLAALTIRRALPSIFEYRAFVAAGGLMSYRTNPTELYLLKGGEPSDLPVFQSRQAEFIINLRTAQALGLAVAPDLLERATDVIK
jgi:putative tryptophan/tyrosine transport system substrate-binding protein